MSTKDTVVKIVEDESKDNNYVSDAKAKIMEEDSKDNNHVFDKKNQKKTIQYN